VTAALLAAAGVLLLSACGGGGDAGASTTPPPADVSLAATIASMQAAGTLPTLDLSPTVLGTDADANGVRDDIDRFIAALPDSAAQKSALTQLAKGLQATLSADTAGKASTAPVSATLARAVTCIWSRYGRSQAAVKVQTLQEITVNTKKRYDAYRAYNAARNGSVVSLPTGVTCDA
jgi:hypothetical protein